MKYFEISLPDGDVFRVRANTYEEAAQRACKRISGRTHEAVRTTGEPNLSGWFACYRYDRKHNASCNTNKRFHVI